MIIGSFPMGQTFAKVTRMHSSKMRIVRSSSRLDVCLGLVGCFPGREGYLPRGGIWPGGVYLGVSACGIVWLGGVWLGGVCPGGVSAQGGYVFPSMYWGRHPRPVDRILETHMWKYYLAATSLRTVEMLKYVVNWMYHSRWLVAEMEVRFRFIIRSV